MSYLFAFSYCSWDSQGKNTEVVCYSLLQWTTSCQTSPPGAIRLGSAKSRPGADCVSDHEHLIDKFRLKLKKLGETTRAFRYDLNQIPYDYTVEVRNRFKGLDLIDRVSDELRTEVRDIVQETGIKIILKKNKYKKAKWLSEEPYK